MGKVYENKNYSIPFFTIDSNNHQDIKKVLEDKEFSTLSLEDKKATLIDCLDRNMDYIPYADINDSEYKISDEAKKLNKIFYNKG